MTEALAGLLQSSETMREHDETTLRLVYDARPGRQATKARALCKLLVQAADVGNLRLGVTVLPLRR